MRGFCNDLTEAGFRCAVRGPRLAENAKQNPQLVCMPKALYERTSWQVLAGFCEMKFKRVWPVLRPRAPKTVQLVCAGSAWVPRIQPCQVEYSLRQSDGRTETFRGAARQIRRNICARIMRASRCLFTCPLGNAQPLCTLRGRLLRPRAVTRHSRARGGRLGRRIPNVTSAGYLSVGPIGRSC